MATEAIFELVSWYSEGRKLSGPPLHATPRHATEYIPPRGRARPGHDAPLLLIGQVLTCGQKNHDTVKTGERTPPISASLLIFTQAFQHLKVTGSVRSTFINSKGAVDLSEFMFKFKWATKGGTKTNHSETQFIRIKTLRTKTTTRRGPTRATRRGVAHGSRTELAVQLTWLSSTRRRPLGSRRIWSWQPTLFMI